MKSFRCFVFLMILLIFSSQKLFAQSNMNCDTIYIAIEDLNLPIQNFEQLVFQNSYMFLDTGIEFLQENYMDSLLLNIDEFDKSAFGKCGYFIDLMAVDKYVEDENGNIRTIIQSYVSTFPNPCYFEFFFNEKSNQARLDSIRYVGSEL